jgi:hypothetical protein
MDRARDSRVAAHARRRPRARGRFVREREAALSALVKQRPMMGERLEVEVRPDIAILWEQDVPLAARLGASMLVRHGGDLPSRTAIEDIASAEGLVLHRMGEQRLWKLLGVPD